LEKRGGGGETIGPTKPGERSLAGGEKKTAPLWGRMNCELWARVRGGGGTG